ncbi:MAG: hypothetical protein KGJ72_04040, partial [Gammaproteobacteria bacterium]|nr:hypothetical protein [Gammaproteobacteria bacterium]
MLRGLYTPRIRRGREWARRLSGPFTARLPLVCAALSGAAGLLYQVIWNRQLLLLFGSTSAAVAAVVAAFMGGMGLGAWGVERWDLKDRRRALGLYALLELGTAGFALIFHLLLPVLQGLYPTLWQAVQGRPEWLNALRLGLGMATLSPATLMMGATLPLLVATLQGDRRRAQKAVGWVYGLYAGG